MKISEQFNTGINVYREPAKPSVQKQARSRKREGKEKREENKINVMTLGKWKCRNQIGFSTIITIKMLLCESGNIEWILTVKHPCF